MSSASRLAVLPSVDEARIAPIDDSILSEIPDVPAKLTHKEKKVWIHVAEALKEYGLIHRTDGLILTVICKTFVNWIEVEVELERFKDGNGGSYVRESGNGYRAVDPLFYAARDLRKELLVYLPEAALTIPSFHKIKGEKIADNSQGKLFEDPVEAFRAQKSAIGMRVVPK